MILWGEEKQRNERAFHACVETSDMELVTTRKEDDPITKPYNTAILLAKIASLLKKAYPAQQREQIVYGDTVLHLESSSLDYHGQSVELTKNELKILYYLFKNGGKICSRGDIIEYLWDNQLYVDDNALSVNINRIREKLSGIGLTDFIKTKHRQGYTI